MEKKTSKSKVAEKPKVTGKTVKAPAARKEAPAKEKTSAAPAAKSFYLHRMAVPQGAHKRKKLLGRGSSSGHGKTSTRGSKGQTSRAGRDMYAGFEGGQTPLIRRFPKRGFTNKFRKTFQIVNLGELSKIKDAVITPEVLKAAGLVADASKPVKILGEGDLTRAVTIKAHAISKSAEEKITKAGAKFEVVVNA